MDYKFCFRGVKKIFLFIWGCVLYINDFIKFYALSRTDSIDKKICKFMPIIMDRYKAAGSIDIHYFLQDIYVASKVIENNIGIHYDVGSRVDGFISHLLASPQIEKVKIIDIRPLKIQIDKLDFIQADATNLEGCENETIDSLSSLHAIEHFGLGRYGDPIDPNACYKALEALKRVLKTNGLLYLSVPIGPCDAVYFNAHRVFSPLTIVKNMNNMRLEEFTIISNYKLHTFLNEEAIEYIENNLNEIKNYDCGVFVFRKL